MISESALPVSRCGLVFESHIAKGGWSEIYRAKREADGKVVAVKAIDKGKLRSRGGEGWKLLYHNEISIHMKVAALCEFVVAFFEWFDTVPECFLVLELMSCTLRLSVLALDGLVEEETWRLMGHILKAIHVCHQNFICHLDVKLENILLTADNKTAKLTDFGLAVQKDHLTWNERNLFDGCGTALFAAPEMSERPEPFSGGPSDIWSFGVCLYQCLVDDENFDAFETVTNPLISIFDLLEPKDVSRELQAVICSCLKLKQDERVTATDLLKRWRNPSNAAQ